MRYVSGYRNLLETIFKYGFKGFQDELRNRKTLWSVHDFKGAFSSQGTFGTSISDIPEYISICKIASEEPEVLSKFKRCYEYRLVLEHVTRYQGQQYLSFIENDKGILDVLEFVSEKEIGEPFRYCYRNLGSLSPTQIRYAKIVRDVHLLFPKIVGGNIVEVGVGNGGLAAQLSKYFELSRYSLVDLPEVLALTSKILTSFDVQTHFDFIPPLELKGIESDLFISNYAFSELRKEIQDMYLDNLISKAKSGYMIYNHIHDDSSVSYSALEIQKMIPGAEIFEEVPLTYDGNVLLVWGHDKLAGSENFSRLTV